MQHFTNRMEVYTVDLTLNLLLPHVILTHVTTCNFKSTDSSIMKLVNTKTPICDFETPLKGLDHQLWLI